MPVVLALEMLFITFRLPYLLDRVCESDHGEFSSVALRQPRFRGRVRDNNKRGRLHCSTIVLACCCLLTVLQGS